MGDESGSQAATKPNAVNKHTVLLAREAYLISLPVAQVFAEAMNDKFSLAWSV